MAPPRAALPDHQGEVRGAEGEAGLRRAGDGLGLAALLGVDARIGPGRVDEGEDRQPEAPGEVHEADRLAVALGAGHAEIVADARLGAGALLLPDHADGPPAEAAEAAHDGLVLAEAAVAGQRRELADQRVAVIDEVRALRMAGDLRLLPGREGGVELGEGRGGLALEPRHVLGDRHRAVAGAEGAQLLQLGLEFGDRLFEIEVGAHRIPC